MDIAVVAGIVVVGIIVGLLLKKIVSFLILSIVIAAGVWFFVLDDNQKGEIEKRMGENQTVQDMKKKMEELSGEAKEIVEEKSEEVLDKVKN